MRRCSQTVSYPRMTESMEDRPIIVHCIALLIQHRTACDDDEAIDAAWAVFRYMGEPERLPLCSMKRALGESAEETKC